MPHVDECQGYPVCQFTSDWCDRCGPQPGDAAILAEASRLSDALMEDLMQTSGTFPQLNTGKKKGKGKRGC